MQIGFIGLIVARHGHDRRFADRRAVRATQRSLALSRRRAVPTLRVRAAARGCTAGKSKASVVSVSITLCVPVWRPYRVSTPITPTMRLAGTPTSAAARASVSRLASQKRWPARRRTGSMKRAR